MDSRSPVDSSSAFTNPEDDTPPSPHDLASIAGLVNSEMNKINTNIVGDHSKLKTSRITEADIYRVTGVSNTVNRPTQQVSRTSPAAVEQHSTIASQPVLPTSITIDTTDIDKFKKKTDKALTSIKRRLTKIDKDIESLSSIANYEYSQISYKVVTDNIDCKCSNTNTLINTILVELQSKPAAITITRV